MKPIFIAEVKTKSPFGYESEKSWDQLFKIADGRGDWLSIHTDLRWGGSFDLLAQARQQTEKPILAKGIHPTDKFVERAIECGADYVLVVDRLPKGYVDSCIIEPRNSADLEKFDKSQKVVWNARDLRTGMPKSEPITEIRAKWLGWLAQASFIRTADDICAGVDALIVGEHLEEFVQTYRS